MSRKGVIYTLVAVVLLFAVATIFFASSQRTMRESQAAVSERVLSVDEFIENFAVDSARAAQIAGFRSLIAMEQHVIENGSYLADADATFLEIFLTGNLSGDDFIIMENSSFNEYLQRVAYEAGSQGITFNATMGEIVLWQNEPWSVLVNYTLLLNVTDTRGTAAWSVERTYTGKVPIVELRDPLFSIGTLARVQRVILKTNVTQFVNDAADANDTTGLLAHFNNTFYIAAGRGPTLLMRFEGNLTDSPYGIESLVDTQEIEAQLLAINTSAGVVDYKYFSGVDADACNIQNLPARIKLSASDLEIYEIEGKLTYDSC